jgi:Family of unknown function (DUF6496)
MRLANPASSTPASNIFRPRGERAAYLHKIRLCSAIREWHDGCGTHLIIAMRKNRFSTGVMNQKKREAVMARKAKNKRYGRKATQKVKRSMHEMKRGKLKSGRSGKKVKNRKQAIAIGLSEARRAGGKVPRKRK